MMQGRKGGETMERTRKKIDAMLDKITSEDIMNRIYRFVKYMYIYVQKQN